jgi:hypothetical protein
MASPEFDAAVDFDGPPSSEQVSLGRRVLRRVVNDRLRARHSSAGGEFEVFCECGRASCRDGVRDTVLITPELYEKVRSVPAHFLIKHSHAGAVERVVEVSAGLLIVEEGRPVVERVGVGQVAG